MRLKHITPLLVAATLAVTVHAQTLLVDRGLPTANLNNAAGANRSNVAWSFTPFDWLIGDSAVISQTSTLTNIRMWVIESRDFPTFNYSDTASYQLYLGLGDVSTSNLAAVSSSLSISSVTYSGGATYQGSSGSFVNLLQLDFSINVLANAGDVLYFSLGGTGAVNPYLHASNAGLSGSPQGGADDLLVAWERSNLPNWGSFSSAGDGWDKASDINVKIWGTVPEPTTYGVLGAAVLAGLVALRRRHA